MKLKIYHSFPRWYLSGVSTWSRNVIEHLDPGEFDQTVLFTGHTESEIAPNDAIGLPREFLNMPKGYKRMEGWLKLKSLLEANSPCLYLPGYDFHRSCAMGIFPPSVGVVYFVHSDEDYYYDDIRRHGKDMDVIVGVSEFIYRNLVRRFPQYKDKTRYINYGVVTGETVNPRGVKPGEPVKLLYCGRLDQLQKRVFDLPKVAAELDKLGVDFQLNIVGVGNDQKPLRAMIAELPCKDRIQMPGRVTEKEMKAIMADSDVFLLTSDFEGLPLALLEAMESGCVPVVYKIDSGVGDVIKDGESGLLVPHGDTVEFAKTLKRLVEEPGLMPKLSEGATMMIRENYSLKKSCEAYAALFREILKGLREGRGLKRSGKIRPTFDLTFHGKVLRKLRLVKVEHA
jgi:glycosyltransferase involved in cell wall biosynthesis